MFGAFEKLFFGAKFGKEFTVNKHFTVWALDGETGAAMKLRNGSDENFAKLSSDELRALRDAANEILEMEGSSK